MIRENLLRLNDAISAVAQNAGRKPEEIKLIAVSKRKPVEAICEAVEAGHMLFGENYIQELQSKADDAPEAAEFHFIGHLQSNKAKIAAQLCSMIETVDRLKLGKALNKHLEELDRDLDILVQVNIGEDPNKSGQHAEQAEELLRELNTLPRLRTKGLMTIPPYSEAPEDSRIYFRNLRLLAENLHSKGLFSGTDSPELSMGMSGDFHVAIEEGATIIRVGTAIFGERSY